MNWDAIGAIGEVVGAVGVIASLVYLGLQLRQNSKTIAEETVQKILNNYHVAMEYLISDREVNRIWFHGFRDTSALNKDEKALWAMQVHAILRRYESIILESRKHDIDQRIISGIENQWHVVLTMPGAKKLWSRSQGMYSDEFVNFVAQRHDLHGQDESDNVR